MYNVMAKVVSNLSMPPSFSGQTPSFNNGYIQRVEFMISDLPNAVKFREPCVVGKVGGPMFI
jgi:hypothetical protein